MNLWRSKGQSTKNLIASFLVLFLVVTSVSETIFLQKFPVDRILAAQVETRLHRLKSSLQNLSPNTDKQDLYLRTKLAEVYLEELARQSLDSYDNLMQGSKNSVSGMDNIVMGSQNKVNGKGNWIFSTDYNQSSDKVLVLDRWKIQLDNIEKIRSNPSQAIKKW